MEVEIELLSVVQQNQMRDGVDAGAAWGGGGRGWGGHRSAGITVQLGYSTVIGLCPCTVCECRDSDVLGKNVRIRLDEDGKQ